MPNLEKPSLTDSERKAYESYLLAGDDQGRQDAIAKLVPGSAIYYHLWFLERFRVHGGAPLTPDERDKYESFRKQYSREQRFKEIEARLALLQYDYHLSEDIGVAKEILDEIIKSYLGSLDFDHSKPDEEGGH